MCCKSLRLFIKEVGWKLESVWLTCKKHVLDKEKWGKKGKETSGSRARGEEFSQVAFTIPWIDRRWVGWESGEQESERVLRKSLETFDSSERISRDSTGSILFLSRLEIRTHCKAFLMTEEILSYTHPFRAPRCRGNVLSGECEPKDRVVEDH